MWHTGSTFLVGSEIWHVWLFQIIFQSVWENGQPGAGWGKTAGCGWRSVADRDPPPGRHPCRSFPILIHLSSPPMIVQTMAPKISNHCLLFWPKCWPGAGNWAAWPGGGQCKPRRLPPPTGFQLNKLATLVDATYVAKSENSKPTHTDSTQATLSANMFPIQIDHSVCTFTKKFAQEAKWTDLALHTMQAGQTQPGS